jgi:glycosyltransferase involved in cell wall biosynthesis
MRVAIYHNILWSRYKGVVFSQVHLSSRIRGIVATFVQIAETEDMRVALGGVDLSYHQYPFRLLFRGAYTGTPLFRRVTALLKDLYRNPCDLVVIPGYHRTEFWAMLLGCIVLRRKRAVFCDSTYPDRPRVIWKDLAKRWFFGLCDGFFCYGIRSKEYLMSYGVNEAKINYRCQVAALPRDYSAAGVLRQYEDRAEGGGKGPRFLYVGRLAEEKGLYDLLDAFARLHESLPDARLDFVGAGPQADELKARVADFGNQVSRGNCAVVDGQHRPGAAEP